MTSKFYLPSKIASYLKRLQIEYARSKNALFSEVVGKARFFVREETTIDNWNGGKSGHDVLFFLPAAVLGKIHLATQEDHGRTICNNLNSCARSVENEFFAGVYFELEDENDPEYQKAISLSGRAQVNIDTLSFWKPGQIRLFISHRDAHKVTAKELANALESYGVSAFVAHDTIEPMKTWQAEILKGLESMEAMLAFVTDDFHKGTWTNQEIGFALGRNVPIIPLKLQENDPSGFIGSLQAQRGTLANPSASALKIYKLLAERIGEKGRLQSALVTAFVQSPDFAETKVRFDLLAEVVKSLSDDEVAEIIRGFRENNQLHNAFHLTNEYNRLRDFLKRTTGKDYVIQGINISLMKEKVDDEMPF